MILDLFDPSFSQNLRSDWVHFFLCAEPGYRKVGEVSPPPGGMGVLTMLRSFLVEDYYYYSVRWSGSGQT